MKPERNRNQNSPASQYRHEFKYLCTNAQLAMLRVRLNGLMQKDSHAGAKGEYAIKSMYFDDIDESCLLQNENGTSPREKYRIRIYNNNPERICLECKQKENDKVKKTSCLLTPEQYEMLAFTKGTEDMGTLPELAKKLLILKKCRGMAPKVIVSYDRTPYVCPYGNVRVTFDCNIASSDQMQNFFSEHMGKRQILPAGQQLLEVKYDEYLPDPIYHALSLANMQRITFSKYYLCRRYHL